MIHFLKYKANYKLSYVKTHLYCSEKYLYTTIKKFDVDNIFLFFFFSNAHQSSIWLKIVILQTIIRI